jgi:site-specific DNA-methyltransferase (adenine-specific)
MDIHPVQSASNERMGYPTQKPLALLERIIRASSNEGDWVLDPFCGCGTAVAAAQQLGRHWIGIDVTHLAIALVRYRLESMFPGIQFRVVGEPQSVSDAHRLAHDSRFQFEWWALSLVGAKPLGGAPGSKQGKKGADRGIDGVINFVDDPKGAAGRVLVQVKSGHITSAQVRDLHGVVDREGAVIGVLITLESPSLPMVSEAISAGMYHSPGWNRDYPRVQIITIEELLAGRKIEMPPQWGTFKQAPRAEAADGKQGEMFGRE